MALVLNAIPNQSVSVVGPDNRCNLQWYQFFQSLAPAKPVPFAERPIAVVEGTLQPFTDSTVNTWGTAIAGGGAFHVLGYWDGTAWTVAAI